MKSSRPFHLLTNTILLIRQSSAHLASSTNLTSYSYNPFSYLNHHLPPFFSRASSTSAIPNMAPLAPVICISHGGGPMPILGDPTQAAITRSLQTRAPRILKLGTPDQPRAIVLVTAHWSTNVPTVSSAKSHDLLYDYYGFPPEAYQLKYDAPGSPEVAGLVENALKEAGLESRKDAVRGKLFWSGVFGPWFSEIGRAHV